VEAEGTDIDVKMLLKCILKKLNEFSDSIKGG
jgi:hypothetical protein